MNLLHFFTSLSLAILAVAAVGCSPSSGVEADAVTLREKVEALHDSLAAVDSLAVENALIVYRVNLERLAPYAADSSKRDVVVSDGTTLDRSAKNLFKFQAQRRVWMGALTAGSARLKSLAHDVRTEYLDTAQGRVYLVDEQGALWAVLQDARSRMHAAQWCLDKADSLNVRMEDHFARWGSPK
jgi:hypothetical protein